MRVGVNATLVLCGRHRSSLAIPRRVGREASARSTPHLPLASYQYDLPGTPADRHLGFIIDDVEPSPSVTPIGDTVDLYAYTSMAVAAVQEQAPEIDQLTREVASLRQELKEARLGRPRRHARRQ
jgi:hypothetical protein